MITKEQALSLKSGQVIKQVKAFNGDIRLAYGSMTKVFISNGTTKDLDKPLNWRVNGKCKTWKTRPDEFKLPIKHGLYDYGYIDHTNNHLFELEG